MNFMYFLPTKVNISDMKINNIDHLGSISFSSTVKKNINVSGKKNQGFGQQLADETFRIFSQTSIMDQDMEDSSTKKTTNYPVY